MNKALAVGVVLFAVLALSFATNRSAIPVGTLAGPRVIAKVNLTNQSALIPMTTIFTPQQTGLYRVSEYMTMTTPAAGGSWNGNILWTDDAGLERSTLSFIESAAQPPSDFGVPNGGFQPDCSVVFHALAGTPITYDVEGSPAGTYSLYIVVERLD